MNQRQKEPRQCKQIITGKGLQADVFLTSCSLFAFIIQEAERDWDRLMQRRLEPAPLDVYLVTNAILLTLALPQCHGYAYCK